jgi:hypothetical protein
MSTRCQVIIKDAYDSEIWFYRHSDGYPEGVESSLQKFLDLVKSNKIRDNAEQASGWLIIIGREEYACYPQDWKVGAYEPSISECHGDIEYLYIVDLKEKVVLVCENPEGKKTTKDMLFRDFLK